MAMISVTPIEEMQGDKHIVHPEVLVNPMVIRKIEMVEVPPAPPAAPIVPKSDSSAKEPIAPPPASAVVVPPVAPVMLSMITFIDGKTMHVKEEMAIIKAMVV